MDDPRVWKEVLDQCRSHLREKLDGSQVADHLRLVGTITESEWHKLKAYVTPDEILIELLDILPKKDFFWIHLLEYLENASQRSVKGELLASYLQVEQTLKKQDGIGVKKDHIISITNEIHVDWCRNICLPKRVFSYKFVRKLFTLVVFFFIVILVPLYYFLPTDGQRPLAQEATKEQDVYDDKNDSSIWWRVIHENKDILKDSLNGKDCAKEMRRINMITQAELETILELTATDATLKLLDILVWKDYYWKELLNCLHKTNQDHLKDHLLHEYDRLQKLQKERGTPYPLTSVLIKFQKSIQEFIKKECQPINVWRELLSNLDLSEAYVGLDISIKEQRDKSLPVEDGDYSKILEESKKKTRIVIQGDPGVGKTFWMCNLAVNWAKSFDEDDIKFYHKYAYLRKRFDFVIYIPLGRVDADGIVDIVKMMVDNKDAKLEDIESIFSNRSRVLLLLDGYDEMVNVSRLQELDDIINMKKWFEVKTIIATRPSHTNSISIQHLLLKINGFSGVQAELFIQKQGIDPVIMKRDLQLDTIRQNNRYNPLQLAALCAVARDQPNLELLDSADGYALLIEWLIMHIFTRKMREKYGKINDEEFKRRFWEILRKLGPLAVAKAVQDERQKQLIGTLKEVEWKGKEEDLNEAIEAGIIIKKRPLDSRSGTRKTDYVFIHQVVAEFIAAYHLAPLMDSPELCDKFINTFCNSDELDHFYKLKLKFYALLHHHAFLTNPADDNCPVWQQSPLFYFMSKFSHNFTATAFKKMMKLFCEDEDESITLPWFARLPEALNFDACNTSYYSFRKGKEYQIVAVLQAIAKHQNISRVHITGSELRKGLPSLLTLAEELELWNCKLNYSSWNTKLPAKTKKLRLWHSEDNPAFCKIFSRLDLKELEISFKTYDPEMFKVFKSMDCFPMIGSMRNLKALVLKKVSFTNVQVNEWCEAANPAQSLETLEFSSCDFSAVDAARSLKMANMLKISKLEIRSCTLSRGFGLIFSENTTLSLSLETLKIDIHEFGMYEPLLENLKHLTGLTQLDITFKNATKEQFVRLYSYIGEISPSGNFKLVEVSLEIAGSSSLKMANMLETPKLEIRYCTLSQEFRWLFAENTKLSLSLKTLEIGIHEFEMHEPLLENLKHLTGLTQINMILKKATEEQFVRICDRIGKISSSGDHNIEVSLEIAGNFTATLDHLKPIFENPHIHVVNLGKLKFFLRSEEFDSSIKVEDIHPANWTCTILKLDYLPFPMSYSPITKCTRNAAH